MLVLALLLTAALLAVLELRRAERTGYDAVIARPFPAGAALARLKLGTGTRGALRLPGNSSWETDVLPGSRRIELSLGASTPGVRFTVSARVAGDWRTLLSETSGATAPVWQDRTIALEPLSPAPDRLRFDAASGGAHPPDVYWGSVRLIGRRERSLRELVSPDTPPPNVILVSLDTLAADHLGREGSVESVSPHLDGLLGRSVSFRRAYAQYPNTLASHASLFTSLYPGRHGVRHDTRPRRRIDRPTFPALLARHGYTTVAFTEDAYVSSLFGFDQGFDAYDDGDAMAGEELRVEFHGTAGRTFGRARAWLDAHAMDAPFFLFVHTYEVHQPYLMRDQESRALLRRLNPGYRGRFEGGYASLLATLAYNAGRETLSRADLDQLSALYGAEIHYLDREVAALVSHVASLPISNRTLVILTSDHGEEFGEHGKLAHGETLHTQALRVPLGFYWPAALRPREVDAPVQLLDVGPTVLELAGIAPPAGIDGKSLAGWLSGERVDAARPAYAELWTASGECELLGLQPDCELDRLAVQTESFKLITSAKPPFERLYHTRSDPAETEDVGLQNPRELDALRSLLAAYREHAAMPGSGTSIPAPTLDERTRERLRALGYAD